jgi:hypothetical protein
MFVSQAATAMIEMTIFLSQIAILWRHRKILYKEPVHVDLHAKHDEAGCKHEGKIGEKLMQKTSSLNQLHSLDTSKRTNTEINHSCNRYGFKQGVG